MSEAYADALAEQAERNVWRTMKDEMVNMPGIQKTQLAADIAGIFDPTPASDLVGGILSAAQGDIVGVGFSLLGMIPYVGDLGKIGKIAKIAPRTANALEFVLKRSDELATGGRAVLQKVMRLDDVAAARKKAADRVKAAMLRNRTGRTRRCADCRKLGRQKTSRMPNDREGVGKWRNGKPDRTGNGIYDFDPPKTLPDGSTVDSIEFRDGFPVFDDHVVGGKHNLWEVTGNAGADRKALARQMRETVPGWKQPPHKDFVLHHFEDGQVGFVPRQIHDNNGRYSGVSHTGGGSMLDNDLF